MKIQIQTAGIKWDIFVPGFLFSPRLTYWILNSVDKEQTRGKITLDMLKRIFRELRKAKNSNSGWELVHVTCADGAEITITL